MPSALRLRHLPVLGQPSGSGRAKQRCVRRSSGLRQDDEGLGLIRPLDDLDLHARQNFRPHGGLKLAALDSRRRQRAWSETERRRTRSPSRAAPPSRSWMSAAWTIACINRPCVSTRMWRFLPMIFLPAS